jgi:hypothetical protein
MSKAKFKVGQVVSYKKATSTKRARKGGTITKVEKTYELKDENKFYYPNGECRGELTTIKELSKGKEVGYAYRSKSIQPEGYTGEISTIGEDNLRLSNKLSVLNSYTIYS